MLNLSTYDKLTCVKLFGMARAISEPRALDLDHLRFDERFGLLVDDEVSERDDNPTDTCPSTFNCPRRPPN